MQNNAKGSEVKHTLTNIIS